jgi:hypothetical protein
MNRRKDPPSLEVLLCQNIREILQKVAVKWTHRLHVAALSGRNRWLQEVKSVEKECYLVRLKLTSLTVPVISELITHYSVSDFTKAMSSFDTDAGLPFITRVYNRGIYEDICTHMLKSVLLPCLSRLDMRTVDSDFVQMLLIKLLYVIPNVKALMLPLGIGPRHLQIFKERIQILIDLQELCFLFDCTTEIIIELSKYCPRLKKLSVEYSRRVDDNCVKHLLKLRNLISLNVADTSISAGSYAAILWRLPQIEDVTWIGPIEPVLINLKTCLPLVRDFVGTVSVAKLLVRKLPNVTKLTLYSLNEDPSDLATLRNVAELSIQQNSPTPVKLGPVITHLGPSLTKLNFFGVMIIDMNDVISCCTALNELSITFSNLTSSERVDRKSAHFKNLKNLILTQNTGTFSFSSVLHLYVNLNVLRIVGMAEMTDQFIRQVVTADRFKYITEFVVEHCGDLNIQTAFLLMNNCPSLIKLGNIDMWPEITNEDAVMLLNYVRINNLLLTVCR